MLGLKLIMKFTLLVLTYASESNGDIMPVGGQRDPNNCLIGAGFTWCESSQSCIRQWITPCEDHFTDCGDCLSRQKNGENIACPEDCDLENINCNTDKDCDERHFCRLTSMDTRAGKECVPFSNEGDPCGGYTVPWAQARCLPDLECVNSVEPMVADAPGTCMIPCKPGSTRNSYGNCDQIRTDIMVPEPVLTGAHCMPCPPPVPCPAPGPDCHYTPEIPDDCGCIIGCGEINCYTIDPPMPPMPPMPPTLPPSPTLSPPIACPDVMCMMYCENDFQKDENGCNICQCNEDLSCEIPYEECDNIYACPKVTEITHCSEGGLEGYTTYQLSIRLKQNVNIKNIYAIYGSENQHTNLIIPPAKHIEGVFGNNIGGVSDSIININPLSRFDSWLTIGITDGNINNDIDTIGIDFKTWTENNGLIVDNGAVFLMDPNREMDITQDIILGQFTIPTGTIQTGVINIQGKTLVEDNINPDTWTEENMQFTLNQPNTQSNGIPHNCITWFDGCNTCNVREGVIGACTRMMCFREETPSCVSFLNGH